MSDFQFKIGFITEGKDLDSALLTMKGIRAESTSLDTILTNSMHQFNGDLETAKKQFNLIVQAMENLKAQGKDTLSVDELTREYKQLDRQLRQTDERYRDIVEATEQEALTIRQTVRNAEEFNRQLQQTNQRLAESAKHTSVFKKAFDSVMKNAGWKVTNATIQSVVTSMQTAYYYAKDFDRAMNSIKIVTGQSNEELQQFALKAGDMAASVSSTLLDFSDSAKVFLQQGKSMTEAQELAKQAIIASNITGQSAKETAELLTAAQEGFNRAADEASNTIDIFSRLGAETGANFREISEALSKSASSFADAGFSIEEASAALATVSTVTRQSAEQIGTGFKTIVARLSKLTLKSNGDITSSIESALQRINQELDLSGDKVLSIYGENGDLKKGSEIFKMIGNNWKMINEEASQTSKSLLTQAMAGSEQANRMLALLNNWEMYTETVDKANEAQGYAFQQQLIYEDSIDAKLKEISNNMQLAFVNSGIENIFSGTLDSVVKMSDAFKDVVSSSSGFAQILTSISNLTMPAILIGVEKMRLGFKEMNGQAELERQRATISENIVNLSLQEAISRERVAVYNQQIAETEEEIKNATSLTLPQLNEYEKKIQNLVALKEKESQIVEQITNDIRAQNAVMERAVANSRNMSTNLSESFGKFMTSGFNNLKKNLLSINSLIAILPTAINSITVAMDETATATDKARAGFTGLSTVVGGIIGTFFGNTGIGVMLGQMLGSLASAFIDIKTEFEKLEEQVDKANEKISLYNEQLKKYSDLAKNSKMSKADYDTISGSGVDIAGANGAMKYAEALRVVADETGKYTDAHKELSQTIINTVQAQGEMLAKVDPSLVYYDELNRAIPLTILNYQELTDTISGATAEASKPLLEAEEFAQTAKTVDTAKQKVEDLRKELNRTGDVGLLDEINKYNELITQGQAQIQVYTNALRNVIVDEQNLSSTQQKAISSLINYNTSLKILNEEVSQADFEKLINQVARFSDTLDANELEQFSSQMSSIFNNVDLGFLSEIVNSTGVNIFAGLSDLNKEFSLGVEDGVLKTGNAIEVLSKAAQDKMQDIKEQTKELKPAFEDLIEVLAILVEQTEKSEFINGEQFVDPIRLQQIYEEFEEVGVSVEELSDIIGRDLKENSSLTLEELKKIVDATRDLGDNLGRNEVKNFMQDMWELSMATAEANTKFEDLFATIENGEDSIKSTAEAFGDLIEEGPGKLGSSFESLDNKSKLAIIDTLKDASAESGKFKDILDDLMDGVIDDTDAWKESFHDIINLMEESGDITAWYDNSESYFNAWLAQSGDYIDSLRTTIGLTDAEINSVTTLGELKSIMAQRELEENQVKMNERQHYYDEEERLQKESELNSQVHFMKVKTNALEMMRTFAETLGQIMGVADDVIKEACDNINYQLKTTAIAIRELKKEADNVKEDKEEVDKTKESIVIPYVPYNPDSFKPKEKKKKKEKKYSQKDMERVTEDTYRYEKALDMVEKKLNKVARAMEGAYGLDKIALINKQIQLETEKSSYLDRELSFIQSQKDDLMKKLQSKGFKFNDIGTITNLTDQLNKYIDKANSINDKTEKGVEKKKKAQEDAKHIQDLIKDYQDLDKQAGETNETLNETYHEIRDLYAEGFEIKINFVYDLNESLNKVAEAKDNLIENFQNDFGQIPSEINKSVRSINRGSEQLAILVENLGKIISDPKLDMNTKYELAQKNLDNFISQYNKLKDQYNNILQQMNNIVGESQSWVDAHLSGFSSIISQANKLASLYTDIYGDKGLTQANKYFDAQINGIHEQVYATQILAGSMQSYADSLTAAGFGSTEAAREARAQAMELNNQIIDLIGQTVDVAQAKYQAFLDTMMTKITENVFGMPFDEITDHFDRLQDYQDKYLDTTEKIVNVSDLRSKILNNINKADDLDEDTQKELTEQLEKQIKLLREKDNLNERDLERLEIEYALKLKQKALDQQDKNATLVGRLTRDESGNWGMEFVKDVNETKKNAEKAQKELIDTLSSLADFDRESLEQNQEAILKAYQDYIKKNEEYMNTYKNDPAEAQKFIDKNTEIFEDTLKRLEKEREELLKNYMNSSLSAIFATGQIDETAYNFLGSGNSEVLKKISDAIAEEKITVDDLINGNFSKVAESIGMDSKEVEKVISKMLEKVKGDFKDMNDLIESVDTSNLVSEYDKFMNEARSLVAEIRTAMNEYAAAVGEVNQRIAEQAAETAKANAEAAKQMNTVAAQAGELKKLREQMEKVNKMAEVYFEWMEKQLKQQKEQAENTLDFTERKAKEEEQLEKTTSATDKNADAQKRLGDETEKTRKKTNDAQYRMELFEDQLQTTKTQVQDAAKKVERLGDAINDLRSKTVTITYVEETRKVTQGTQRSTLSLDTGGYTGPGDYTGGVDGKGGIPAILHPQELVLNKSDTKNMLAIIGQTRKLVQAGLQNKLNPRSLVKNAISNTYSNESSNNSKSNTYVVENINLPNVENATQFASELQNIFAGLSNDAIQYSHKYKNI